DPVAGLEAAAVSEALAGQTEREDAAAGRDHELLPELAHDGAAHVGAAGLAEPADGGGGVRAVRQLRGADDDRAADAEFAELRVQADGADGAVRPGGDECLAGRVLRDDRATERGCPCGG